MKDNNPLSPFNSERARQMTMGRAHSLANLSISSLTRALDAFDAGHLREAALIWEALEQRDDMIRSVAPKRKKTVTRHGWEVLTRPNLSPEQEKQDQLQKHALQYFYENLSCANAVDENERGAFKLLVRQMMDAVGKRYAVHEIQWQPIVLSDQALASGAHPQIEDPDHPCCGQRDWLTARFRFVPLWFFENTEGVLKFLPADYALKGQPLEPGNWMVTVGDGVMIACSLVATLKRTPLADWHKFSGRFGMPAVLAMTNAPRNTPDWDAMVASLGSFLDNLNVVTNSAEKITPIDLKGSGAPPFEALVSRMDRMITVLWRGADLSTLSRDRGYGASLQEGETDILEQDDAEMITETLNQQVDRQVIERLFGCGAPQLAGIKVLVSPRKGTEHDLRVDEFLARNGARLSVSDALARYGRAPADPNEPILESLA